MAYFDGVLLYVCAYRIGDPWKEASRREIEAVLQAQPEFSMAQGVCIWGRYKPLPAVTLGEGRRLPCAVFRDYDPLFVDAVVDLGVFNYETHKKARLAVNAVERSDLQLTVVRRGALLGEHLALIAEWASTHSVSQRSAGVLVGLPIHVKEPHVRVVECRWRESLMGFAVVSLMGDHSAIFTQGFSRRVQGLRIGDAMYSAMLGCAVESGLRRLHLGYSATEELLRFKMKWGAQRSGPPFRDALFTESRLLKGLFEEGRFRWHERVALPDGVDVRWQG